MTTKPVMSMLAAIAALNAANALLGASPSIKIYSGAQPATTLTAEGGTLGATLPMSATAFPTATSGTSDGLATATANAITSETNAPNGITAGHFRILTSGAVCIFQGNCGTSGADLNMNTLSITAGDTVAITSFKDTLPCGDGVS